VQVCQSSCYLSAYCQLFDLAPGTAQLEFVAVVLCTSTSIVVIVVVIVGTEQGVVVVPPFDSIVQCFFLQQFQQQKEGIVPAQRGIREHAALRPPGNGDDVRVVEPRQQIGFPCQFLCRSGKGGDRTVLQRVGGELGGQQVWLEVFEGKFFASLSPDANPRDARKRPAPQHVVVFAIVAVISKLALRHGCRSNGNNVLRFQTRPKLSRARRRRTLLLLLLWQISFLNHPIHKPFQRVGEAFCKVLRPQGRKGCRWW